MQGGITFSVPSHLQLVWMTRTCMANKYFGTKAQFFVPEQTVMHYLAVSMSAIAKSAGFRIPAHSAFAFASIHALNSCDLHSDLHYIDCAACSAHEAVLTPCLEALCCRCNVSCKKLSLSCVNNVLTATMLQLDCAWQIQSGP